MRHGSSKMPFFTLRLEQVTNYVRSEVGRRRFLFQVPIASYHKIISLNRERTMGPKHSRKVSH
jgi:small-conductance mechanosensitive channel